MNALWLWVRMVDFACQILGPVQEGDDTLAPWLEALLSISPIPPTPVLQRASLLAYPIGPSFSSSQVNWPKETSSEPAGWGHVHVQGSAAFHSHICCGVVNPLNHGSRN